MPPNLVWPRIGIVAKRNAKSSITKGVARQINMFSSLVAIGLSRGRTAWRKSDYWPELEQGLNLTKGARELQDDTDGQSLDFSRDLLSSGLKPKLQLFRYF